MRGRKTSIFGLALGMLITFLAPLASGDAYHFAGKIGRTLEYGLSNPQGIATDAQGNLYVADHANGRVQKFSPSGIFLAKWDAPGAADIAINAAGQIYVADYLGHRILRYSSSGAFLGEWGSHGSGDGQFEAPVAVAVDAEANVYVVEYFGNRLQKFDPYGVFLAKWGAAGNGDGQLSHPRGVAVDSAGNIYVSETGNHRVQKFDPNGNPLGWWGKGNLSSGWHPVGSGEAPVPGSGLGEFNSPSDIAIDAYGYIYVSDSGNGRIQKISPSGNSFSVWGSSGIADGELSAPVGLAFDLEGNVLVAESNSNRIQKFTATGTFLSRFGNIGTSEGEFAHPYGVAVDSLNNLYVADVSNDRIQVFRPTGSFLMAWGSHGTGDGQLNDPRCVAVDGSDRVYVTEFGNHRVSKFTWSGSFLTKFGSYGTGDGQFIDPMGLAIGADGSVYVADSGNHRVQKWTYDSGSGTYSFAGWWGRGNMTTGWHEPGSGEIGVAGNGDGEFSSPWAVAIDTAGNLLIADKDNHRIQKYDSHGTYLGWWGFAAGIGIGWHPVGSGAIPEASSLDGGFNSPRGIAVFGDRIYVADTENLRIQRFDLSGNFVEKWGNPGTGDGQFSFPTALACNSAGAIYVSDTSVSHVQKFVPCERLTPAWSLKLGSTTASGVSTMGHRAVFGSDAGILYCVDAITGTLSWSFNARANGAGPTASIKCRPAVYGPPDAIRIYFSTTDGFLFCLDTEGNLIWKADGPIASESTPAVWNNRVYVGGINGLFCFRADTGQFTGICPIAGVMRSSPAVPGTDLVWVGAEDGKLYCVFGDLSLIRSITNAGTMPIVTSPSVDWGSRRVTIGTTGRNVRCVHLTSFGTIWNTPVDGAVTSGNGRNWPPTNTHFGTSLGTLYALSFTNGAVQWTWNAPGSILSAPVLYSDWAYFGTENGYFYALNTRNRSEYALFQTTSGSFTLSPALCLDEGASAVVAVSSDGWVYGFPLR